MSVSRPSPEEHSSKETFWKACSRFYDSSKQSGFTSNGIRDSNSGVSLWRQGMEDQTPEMIGRCVHDDCMMLMMLACTSGNLLANMINVSELSVMH